MTSFQLAHLSNAFGFSKQGRRHSRTWRPTALKDRKRAPPLRSAVVGVRRTSSILPEGGCTRGNESFFGTQTIFVRSACGNDGRKTSALHQSSRLLHPDKLGMVPPCKHHERLLPLRGIHPLHHILGFHARMHS